MASSQYTCENNLILSRVALVPWWKLKPDRTQAPVRQRPQRSLRPYVRRGKLGIL